MKLLTVQSENILSIEDDTPQAGSRFIKPHLRESNERLLRCVWRGKGKVHLETDPNVAPTVMPPRRVPIALKEKLKAELERLTQRQAISRVEDPTDWVSSMIATLKPNGSIRLCIDPHYLNQALKRSHYPLPVIEDDTLQEQLQQQN